VTRRGSGCIGIALVVSVVGVVVRPARGQEAPTPLALPAPDGGTQLARPGGSPDAVTHVPRSVSFREAWETALARNPTVTTAVQEIRRVTGLMEETRAASLPTLGVNATYVRLDKDRSFVADPDAGAVVVQAKDSINVTGTLAIPILAPQAWANWKRAADLIENSKLSQRDFQRQVAINVARAYITIFAQKRQVDVNRQARDNAQAHLTYADQRLRGGIGNKVDWARAGQDLEANEALLQNSYANLYRSQEALGILLGVDEPVDTQEIPQLPIMPTLDEGLSETPTRADLILFNQEVATADRSLNMSWTEYMPNITLFGQPIFQSPASLTTPKTSWQIQAVLTWALYDGGARYGRTHEREAQLEQAKIQLAASIRQANSEVRTSIDNFDRSAAAVQRARKSAELANEAMRLAEISYRAGATTNLELIDAQRRARDAETLAVIGEDNALQAALDLLAASGRFPPSLRDSPQQSK
jgi:outer membrane protein